MAPPEPRASSDHASTLYYNMKTARPQPPQAPKSFNHVRSQSNNYSKPSNKPSSPITSPRGPLPVGQVHPPRLSPSVVPIRHLSTPAGQGHAQSSKTASPNYFGLQPEASVDAHESGNIPGDNWSSPSSSVKSFTAAIPKQVPVDGNPDFEAFLRQADANRGNSFSLGSSHFGGASSSLMQGSGAATTRPRPPRWHTHGSDVSVPPTLTRSNHGQVADTAKSMDAVPQMMDVDNASTNTHKPAYVSADSARNSDASLNPPSFLDLPRRDSPAQYETPPENRSGLSNVDDRHPRLSLVQGKADPPSPDPERFLKGHKVRSDTVPSTMESGSPGMISPTHIKDMIDSPSKSAVLVLDLRVSPQYAQSRIKGALNLCIPTTLLKRATFNLQKLQQTFQADADQEKFARWRETKHIVVYDAFSSDKRDAVSAMNTIKKFTNEGYTGVCSILRGGFNAFAAAYPALIERGNTAGHTSCRPTLSLAGSAGSGIDSRPTVAPVVGGVMLPSTSNVSNPFFANIRQNQDLVDGVGQMDVKVPHGTEMEALPRWLREAAASEDHGGKVSEKFLNIELAEQSRMKGAYSHFNPGTAANAAGKKSDIVQLSGIEKGGKNRYKDILPFEHARVKLEGKPDGACDYVNASHIKAFRSHKRYIASQGPLPATFEDFWSVIWDQDVRVIIMLTAESEGGQLKCHPYWTGREFGNIKLRALSEKKVSLEVDNHRSQSAMPTEAGDPHSSSTARPQEEDAFGFGAAATELGRRRANTTTTLFDSPNNAQPKANNHASNTGETAYVIIRKFALSHAAHPFAPIREITHLHYPAWPDFGTPAQPSHLLALVELANIMQHTSLPVNVPSAMAQAQSVSRPEPPATKEAVSPSPKKRSRASSNMPITWYDEPESDQTVRPMLVHCSAGCGRTGTFCTVDSVIDMLKRQRLRNIKRANANIERKVRAHKLQAPLPPYREPDGDIGMAGLSFTSFQGGSRGGEESRSGLYDDAISPGTAAPPLSPQFPDMGMSMSPSPLGGSSSSSHCSDDDDDPNLDTSWIDDDTVDLIDSTVSDFRCQRLSMVQSLRQFVLCYETIIEWVWRLQERGGPAGSVLGAPGTGAGGTAAMRARGRSGTVAGAFSK